MSDLLKKMLGNYSMNSNPSLRGKVIFSDEKMPNVLIAIPSLIQNSRFPDFAEWDKRFQERYPPQGHDFLSSSTDDERRRMWHFGMEAHYKQKPRLSLDSVKYSLFWPTFSSDEYSLAYFFPYASNFKIRSSAYFSERLPNEKIVREQIEKDIILCKEVGITVQISSEAQD